MTNPWDDFASQALPLLRSSVADFLQTEKPEVEAFLKNKSVEYAKQTWSSVNGSSDEEKQTAVENLRHLKSQVIMEAIDLQIVATAKALGLLSKVFDVLANVAINYGSKMLVAL